MMCPIVARGSLNPRFPKNDMLIRSCPCLGQPRTGRFSDDIAHCVTDVAHLLTGLDRRFPVLQNGRREL